MIRVQLAGVGSLRPNTIVGGWPSHATAESAKSVVSLIQLSRAYNKACMFLKAKHDNFPSEDDKLTGTIDLWWILQEVSCLASYNIPNMLIYFQVSLYLHMSAKEEAR